MAAKDDRRSSDNPDMVIVHRPSTAIIVLLSVMITIFVIGMTTVAVVSLNASADSKNAAKEASKAADKANKNANRIRAVERKDARLSRRAAFRICERGNLTRAELHAAYQTPPPFISVEAMRTEPFLVALLRAVNANSVKSLNRVQKLNPILNCSPNLNGESAKPYSRKRQEAFVRDYVALKLNPLPVRP